MARLLVTGGNGMVGRNLLAHPDIAAWQVMAPSRTELDLCDATASRDWLLRHRPDAVVHAAGRVGGIQANMAQPLRFLDENTRIGLNLIAACRLARVPVLINLSSSCVYPRDLGRDLSEEQILTGALEPTNEGYALAKIMALRAIEYACHEDGGLMWRTLIPCNLYGPHDSFDPARSHLLAAVIHKLHRARAEARAEVDIWGDGKARREFMYAPDLAEAILRALANPSVLPPLMNIGPGQDHSIDDYYRLTAEVIGCSCRFRHDTERPVGMRQKLLSVTRQTEWGWSPTTPLREGIAATYAHYLEHHA
jgi:GDP-L-fucose synthase